MMIFLPKTPLVLALLVSLAFVSLRAQEEAAEYSSPSLVPIKDVEGLPRVLLIGDSISMGYTIATREALAGKANVHRPPTNCGSTRSGLQNLDAWLGTEKWDVIHFNWGMHDLKYLSPGKQNVPVDQYERNLRELVDRLQRTGAGLVFATTTPLIRETEGKFLRDAHAEIPYNEVAKKVMAETGVRVDDLHAFAMSRLDSIQAKDGVHYTREGSAALAGEVAASITAALTDQAPPPVAPPAATATPAPKPNPVVSTGTLSNGVTAEAVGERIVHYSFDSTALKKPMAFNVIFPPGYEEKGRPWPVLFFLHGLGRNEKTLIEDPASLELLLGQPYVIVLPKGENGWYFDSPFDPSRQFASYLDEVTALAGKVLNISTERAQRAIGGWSAGGFGSMWACLRHPDSFGTLATIIAVVDFPAEGARFPMTPATFGTDPARWPEFNPIHQAAKLQGLHILLVIGEKASDAAMNDRLSAELNKAQIPHEIVRFPGGHSFTTVQSGIGPVLEFVGKHIAASSSTP